MRAGERREIIPGQRGSHVTTRRFELHRDHDVSGVSGTGVVADGVQWPDGSVSIRWRGERPSVVFWHSLADAEQVHGHGGATRFVWLDCEHGTELVSRSAAVAQGQPQRRRRMTRALLREVAEVYRRAFAEGEAPTTGVAQHFAIPYSTAARWVGRARKAGELGPASGPTPGEAEHVTDGFETAHAEPSARPRRRHRRTRTLLREVAGVYRKAHANGEPPTVAVSEHFNVSHRTATRWASEARAIGELGAVGSDVERSHETMGVVPARRPSPGT